jgi:drug/metabolite transporter (DMT)-like permease
MTRFSTFGFLIVAAAFWGFQPSCIKWLVREWTPETLTACRYFLMSVLLLLWAYARVGKAFWPGKKLWPALAIMGFVGITINNVTQFTGLQYTTITNCTLISASSPVIAARHFLYGHRRKVKPFELVGDCHFFCRSLGSCQQWLLGCVAKLQF